MFINKTAAAAGGAVLGLFLAAASMDATGSISRTTHLTFSGPVGLPGVTLGTGTYVFELAHPNLDLNLVRVMDAKQSRVYYTGYTVMVPRPTGQKNRPVTFHEASRGVPAPIDTWFPQDDAVGHQFLYRNR